MARVIAICNQKGGVGKTTTSVNLAAYLAAQGKYVLLVDLDSQANATVGLGVHVADSHPNLYHALVVDHNPETIIKRTSMFGFDVLPSAQSLAGATVELVSMEERESRLKKALNSVRTNYDYIIIDSPPSLGLLTINGLVASDEIIIPVQTEYFALEGLSQLLNTINLIRENLQPKLKVMGALLTMYDKRNRLARQVVKEVQDHFPGHVFDSVIPRSIRLAEAPGFGKSILSFDSLSKGARAYKNLAREIIELDKNNRNSIANSFCNTLGIRLLRQRN